MHRITSIPSANIQVYQLFDNPERLHQYDQSALHQA